MRDVEALPTGKESRRCHEKGNLSFPLLNDHLNSSVFLRALPLCYCRRSDRSHHDRQP